MRIVQLVPTEIKCFGRFPGSIGNRPLLVGSCNLTARLFSRLKFPQYEADPRETIQKAILKLTCIRSCGKRDFISIGINATIRQTVCEIGCYEWDITGSFSHKAGEIIELYLYPVEKGPSCGVREFETIDPATKPVLVLFLDRPEDENHQTRSVDIVRTLKAVNMPSHSEWIDCFHLQKYYFFLKSEGCRSVEVSMEISPDRQLTVVDSGPFPILPGETIYLEPNRFSRFVRLSFWNQDFGRPNALRMWFQGKRE